MVFETCSKRIRARNRSQWFIDTERAQSYSPVTIRHGARETWRRVDIREVSAVDDMR